MQRYAIVIYDKRTGDVFTTLMQAEEGSDLVVTPRELDSVIAHGAALLAAAINRALQPRLSIAQLGWLTS